MLIAILIIACVILIALATSLFLNHKSFAKSFAMQLQSQEKQENLMKSLHAELSDKLTQNMVEMTTTIKSSSTDIIGKAERSFIDTQSRITTLGNDLHSVIELSHGNLDGSVKKFGIDFKAQLADVQAELREIGDDFKSELEKNKGNLAESLMQIRNELTAKYDQLLDQQMHWQNRLSVEVNQKVSEVLEEIKNPLPLG